MTLSSDNLLTIERSLGSRVRVFRVVLIKWCIENMKHSEKKESKIIHFSKLSANAFLKGRLFDKMLKCYIT